MKIRSLLEDSSAYQAFGAVTPFHVSLLKRIASGRFDPLQDDNIDPSTQNRLEDLVNLGLLDDIYSVTPNGEKTINISSSVGTQDLRDARAKAAARRAMNAKNNAEPTINDFSMDNEDDEDDDLDDTDEVSGDEDLGGTLRPTTVKKPVTSKVKPIRRDDFSSFDKDDIKSFDDEGEYRWD